MVCDLRTVVNLKTRQVYNLFQADLPIRPNPDGRKYAKPNGQKSDETAEKMKNRMAEFDETAEYRLAAFPTYYIKAISNSCHVNFLLYLLHIISKQFPKLYYVGLMVVL